MVFTVFIHQTGLSRLPRCNVDLLVYGKTYPLLRGQEATEITAPFTIVLALNRFCHVTTFVITAKACESV